MDNLQKNSIPLSLIFSVIALIASVIVLFSLGRVITSTLPGSGQSGQGISVNGLGTVEVEPDQAQVILGVESDAKTAQEAQAKNAAIMNRILAELKKLAISDKDIQTTDFSLYPNRQFIKETGREQVVGYHISNQVTVTVRALNKLGETIDSSIASGATNVNNVLFSVSSPDQWKEKAITNAVRDARAKAEVMAKASGARIKRVSYINDSSVNVLPYRLEMKNMSYDAAAQTSIQPGNVKIQVNIQMGFEI